MSDYYDQEDNGGGYEDENYERRDEEEEEEQEEEEEEGNRSNSGSSDHHGRDDRPHYDYEDSTQTRGNYSGGSYGGGYPGGEYAGGQSESYGGESHGGGHGGLLAGLGGGLLGGVIGAAASRLGHKSGGGGNQSQDAYGDYDNRQQSHGQSGAPPPPPQGKVQFGHGAPSEYAYAYSNCTGKRKALLIGINYFGQSGQLSGCINDVHNVSTYLSESFGYDRRDMVILTDDSQEQNSQPTRDNILRAMQWLVNGAQPNDSLFFHYSGHGGSTKDLNGDEEDGNDEVIYPVDYNSVGHILDDDMHTIMVNPLQAGVRLTCIFDSCHSGSALDLPYMYSTSGVVKEPNLAKEAGEGLLNILSSANSGDYGRAASTVFSFIKQASISGEAREKTVATKTSPADVIMWSGSKDDQTSADATINAQATGAMSWAFIGAMKQNPKQSYVQLLNTIRGFLATKYTQKPQLSSSHPIDTDLLFIM